MSKRPTKWCCEGLKHAFAQRRGRGIYVFAEPPKSEIGIPVTFWLGMRSVEKKDLEKLSVAWDERQGALSLQTWRPIRYCPWCGTKLVRFYRNRHEQLH